MFGAIKPTQSEIDATLPGDAIVARPDAVMDRAFSLPATPETVWPWFVQLGKQRAGWYFPRWVERFEPPSRRGLRVIEPKLQSHKVGDIIDDWGGKDGYLEVVDIEAPTLLLYKSTRGKMSMSWAITLRSETATTTRVHIRLKLGPIKNKWAIHTIGEFFDAVTIAGLAAGLRERLSKR